MSEKTSINNEQDQRFSPEIDPVKCDVVDLHGDTIQLSLAPVVEKEIALKEHGINGNIIAIVNLPRSDDDSIGQGSKYKKIAIVDYGEIGDDPPFALYLQSEDKPVPFFGRVKSRFGTQALNFNPKDHGSTYSPLENERTVIGRSAQGAEVATPGNRRKNSYRLGLHEQFAGNASISRDHFTITKSQDDRLSITDHSTNGTQVVISKEL